jgi:hypothetical protein
LKRAVLREVDVFVDGRRDEEAAEFAVVRRQIGAAAAEGHAQGRTGDDHEIILDFRFSIFDWRKRVGAGAIAGTTL